MKSQKLFFLFLVFYACLLSFSHAGRNYYVGDKEGWVMQPKEKYNDWAGRQRFHVKDTLIFKYDKGSDSVLLVNRDDYNNCNRKNPAKKMNDGNSEFTFPHSGPFYFISGEDGHCEKGQKLITVVMAVRHESPKSHPPGPVIPSPPKGSSPGPALPPKSPYPVGKPPQASSPGPALGPSGSHPGSKPPMASSPGPAMGPSGSHPGSKPPMASSPGPAMGPSGSHPGSKPPMASSPGPAMGPAYGPVANAPKGTSPSPSSSVSPSLSPSNSPPSPPGTTTPTSPSQSPTSAQVPSGGQNGNPSNITSPNSPPSKGSVNAICSVTVLTGSLLFSVFMGGF